ncbi:unnamed protein product [Cylicostephanus goldi]|uniref:Cuticlin N-terminal domain-containing protein n=1 Tax=Cylicostephanus goldi TaxID=71465 RepID=A0A3P7MY84_CYLGO|nr:unnamed protein product [Cylicostephanus goldi]
MRYEYEEKIFIKNQRRADDCYVVYSAEDNSTTPEFKLSLNRIASCGIDMRRNPSVGLELFSVFVFAFHPSFVTAGDRAFAVHCLFQQKQLTVSTRFDFISDITPRAVLGATAFVPTVQLSIVHGRVPNGAKVASYVSVGEPLMLIWQTQTDSRKFLQYVKRSENWSPRLFLEAEKSFGLRSSFPNRILACIFVNRIT